MRKIRMWCEGGRRSVQESELRGKHARCRVCGQRFIPKEGRSPEGEPTGLALPPHKAY